MNALAKTTLNGLWAALPTPWTTSGKLDEKALWKNCERLARAKVAGVYTTDSDGEFYAIELAEFVQLAQIFSRACVELGLQAQMGVSWCNTQGVIDRVRVAYQVGIPTVHIALPSWTPLTASDVARFFEDLASAQPEARWIHYAHPVTSPTLSGKDYVRLTTQFPDQLIGTKLTTKNIFDLSDIIGHTPDLAHFVIDSTMLVGMLLGARGCYSYWVNTLPSWHRAWFDTCLRGEWNKAAIFHKKLLLWEVDYITKIRTFGNVAKSRVALTPFLEDSRISKAPYYPVPFQRQEELLRAFQQYWREELRRETMFKTDPKDSTVAETIAVR